MRSISPLLPYPSILEPNLLKIKKYDWNPNHQELFVLGALEEQLGMGKLNLRSNILKKITANPLFGLFL